MKIGVNLFIAGICLMFFGIVGIPVLFLLFLIIGAFFKYVAIGFLIIVGMIALAKKQ
jgi:hypothetical protein